MYIDIYKITTVKNKLLTIYYIICIKIKILFSLCVLPLISYIFYIELCFYKIIVYNFLKTYNFYYIATWNDRKNNVNTIPLFYNYKISEKIKNEYGNADLIIANNCIAHTNQLNDLMEGISNNLSNKGVFVAEFNYWGKMVENNNYSLILLN